MDFHAGATTPAVLSTEALNLRRLRGHPNALVFKVRLVDSSATKILSNHAEQLHPCTGGGSKHASMIIVPCSPHTCHATCRRCS